MFGLTQSCQPFFVHLPASFFGFSQASTAFVRTPTAGQASPLRLSAFEVVCRVHYQLKRCKNAAAAGDAAEPSGSEVPDVVWLRHGVDGALPLRCSRGGPSCEAELDETGRLAYLQECVTKVEIQIARVRYVQRAVWLSLAAATGRHLFQWFKGFAETAASWLCRNTEGTRRQTKIEQL